MEVDPVFRSFLVSCQQRGVEDVMDGPGRWEAQLISDR